MPKMKKYPVKSLHYDAMEFIVMSVEGTGDGPFVRHFLETMGRPTAWPDSKIRYWVLLEPGI